MTTIAYRDGIMAADSQITDSTLEYTNKLRKAGGALYGFCGDYIAAVAYIEYLAYDTEQPHISDRDDFLILMVDGKKVYYVDQFARMAEVKGRFCAIGSGASAAMGAMHMGATAKEAIKIAIKVDPYTGGTVRSVSL